MPTVDLPAFSVSFTGGPLGDSEIVGGPDALSTTDTSTYAILAGEALLEMYDGGNPGFGYIDAAGVTVTNVDIVALCYRENGGDYPPERLDVPNETAAETYPTILWDYIGSGKFWGWNIDHLPLEWGWVSDPVPSGDWFRVLDPSDLPEGEDRLSPSFRMGPINASFYYPEARVFIAYLAARVTYTGGGIPPRRIVRDDGWSSAPRVNRSSSRQHNNRVIGYY